jgi:hypothetical protein
MREEQVKHVITVRKMHDGEPEALMENPEERLDLVEKLRLEAGKFLYEYPTSFRRVVTVVRKGKS